MLRILVLTSVVFLLSGCETLPPDNPADTVPQASNEAGTHTASRVTSSESDDTCKSEVCKVFENILNSADRIKAMDAWLGGENLSVDELKTFMKDKENLMTRDEKKKIIKTYIDIQTRYSNDLLEILEIVAELGLDNSYYNFIGLAEPRLISIRISNSDMDRLGQYGQNQFDVGVFYTSSRAENTTLDDTITIMSTAEDIVILFDILAAQIQRKVMFEEDSFTLTSKKYIVIKFYIVDRKNKKWIAGFLREKCLTRDLIWKNIRIIFKCLLRD